jgi:hypothetical protein
MSSLAELRDAWSDVDTQQARSAKRSGGTDSVARK